MCITPLSAGNVHVRRGPYYLADFNSLMAPVVASWARDHEELFWLAPQTLPPLTAAAVMAWPKHDGSPLLFHRDGTAEPLGYLELNPVPEREGQFWIGHCVIAPDHRGCGLGRLMVELMLEEAFDRRQARSVSLIVFPENTVAVRCYRTVGFVEVDRPVKYFPVTGRQHTLLQMTIDRQRYDHVRGLGQ